MLGHDRARHQPAPPRPRRLRGGPRAAVRQAAHGGPVHLLRPHGPGGFPARRPAHRGRAAPPSHRAIDAHLSLRGRNHAPGQRRLGTADPPRRSELDDRRARHHAFGALRARAARGRAHGRHPGLDRAPEGEGRDRPGVLASWGADLPGFEERGKSIRLIAGEAFGAKSPVPVYSPLFYLHCELSRDAVVDLGTESS